MTVHVPLTPQLETFVRNQLASGRFHTQGEVLRAALLLLEKQSVSQGASSADRQAIDHEPTSKPSEPASQGFWQGIRERPGNDATALPARRSPRGMLADLPSHISADDIKEARSEMWSGLPHAGV